MNANLHGQGKDAIERSIKRDVACAAADVPCKPVPRLVPWNRSWAVRDPSKGRKQPIRAVAALGHAFLMHDNHERLQERGSQSFSRPDPRSIQSPERN